MTGRWRQRVAAGIGLAALVLALIGCGGSGDDTLVGGVIGGEAPLGGQLSDETLAALADDAWAEAGLPGDPTEVTSGNLDQVGGGSVSSADTLVDAATLSAGFSLQLGATGGLTLPKSDNAIRNGVSHTIGPALEPMSTSTYVLTGTYACAGGGSVDLTGTIVVTVQQTLAPDGVTVVSGSIRTLVQDLNARFHACTDAGLTRRVWGVAVLSVDNLIAAIQRPADPAVYDVTLDVNEHLQAGLAYEDLANPGTYYRLPLRYNRTGHIDAVRNTALSPNQAGALLLYGTLSADYTVGGVKACTIVTFSGDPSSGNVVKVCPAP